MSAFASNGQRANSPRISRGMTLRPADAMLVVTNTTPATLVMISTVPAMFIPLSACRFHATESKVIARRGALALPSRADHVPRAILIRAEERSAAVDTFLFGGLGRVERCAGAGGVAREPARRERAVIVRAIPIAAPLPDIAGHVVQPVRIGRE